MKDITTYINEADNRKPQTEKPGESWVAIDIVTPDDNAENQNKEKRSYRVVTYDTYMDMKKSGRMSNGTKIIYVDSLGPSCPSKEKAQEYIKKKKQ